MTLVDALQYLEITSRVSCPQITCDQAREIAEVLRGHQSIIDLAVMLEDGVKHGAGCCDEIGRGRRLTQIREHIEHVLSGRQAEQVKNQIDDAWSERDESRLLADREFTLRQRAEKERDEARIEMEAQNEQAERFHGEIMKAHDCIDAIGGIPAGTLLERMEALFRRSTYLEGQVEVLTKELDEALAKLLHSQICVSGLQAQREESAQSTQIRINLIKIAQEQHMQAHSAIDKLGPFAEGPLAQRIGEVGAAMDSMRVVIDTLRAQLREAERERRAEIDCGQPDVCAKPPGCQKHWAFKASELVRERNEIHARFYLFDCEDGCGCGDRHCWRPGRADTRCITCKLIDSLEETEEVRQTACGFAWDAGREMARLDDKAHEFDAELYKAREYINQQARLRAIEIMSEDFDASDYAKPGKR